ncbi:hypothetical protein HYV89_05045 [Candidatus Woesearchaeota archaeon]|nr:hypothetical protein [Candidatus Woesearchaeota archaeon]
MLNEIVAIASGYTLLKYLASRTFHYHMDKSHFAYEEGVIDKDLRKLREIHSIKDEINLHRKIVMDGDLERRLFAFSGYIKDRYIDLNPISDLKHISDDVRERYNIKLSVLRALYNTNDAFKSQ